MNPLIDAVLPCTCQYNFGNEASRNGVRIKRMRDGEHEPDSTASAYS
jgi:hypothetical protein